jgi:hypothetical protein
MPAFFRDHTPQSYHVSQNPSVLGLPLPENSWEMDIDMYNGLVIKEVFTRFGGVKMPSMFALVGHTGKIIGVDYISACFFLNHHDSNRITRAQMEKFNEMMVQLCIRKGLVEICQGRHAITSTGLLLMLTFLPRSRSVFKYRVAIWKYALWMDAELSGPVYDTIRVKMENDQMMPTYTINTLNSSTMITRVPYIEEVDIVPVPIVPYRLPGAVVAQATEADDMQIDDTESEDEVEKEVVAEGGEPIQAGAVVEGGEPIHTETMAEGGAPAQTEAVAQGGAPVQTDAVAGGGVVARTNTGISAYGTGKCDWSACMPNGVPLSEAVDCLLKCKTTIELKEGLMKYGTVRAIEKDGVRLFSLLDIGKIVGVGVKHNTWRAAIKSYLDANPRTYRYDYRFPDDPHCK